jgi:anti-anti-sigma regulatory factor
MGQHTLRISIQENDSTIGFTLVGRLAGPWVTELEQAWKDVAKRLNGKKLSLDLRDVTYSDAGGKRVLREMFARSRAEFITHSDWSHHLAEEIKNFNGNYANGRA